MAAMRCFLIAQLALLTLTAHAVAGSPLATDPGASGIETTPTRIVLEDGTRIPHGFEEFEPSIRAGAPGTLRPITNAGVDCPDVKEPTVPKVPDWARGTLQTMRKKKFQEVKNTGAFINGRVVVMKLCTYPALAAVISRTAPTGKNRDPHWDIIMDCSEKGSPYTIRVEKTLEFGDKWPKLHGYWRLIAPYRNVVLHGDNKRRILKVQPQAELVVSGITFDKGFVSNSARELSKSQTKNGGWNGAAVLVLAKAAFTAHRCKFMTNTATSFFARWGSGGAIKAETSSFTIVWGCTFVDNKAATGGAIATSSAHVLFVRNSTFRQNKALGGMDGGVVNKGRSKNLILVKGGAIRVDSVTAQNKYKQHVLICDSDFIKNQIIFSKTTLQNKFGYKGGSDARFVRSSSAAINLWNKPGAINLDFTKNFMKIRGCLFEENLQQVMATGKLGRYVVEVEGAGHCTVQDSVFRRNYVRQAVTKVNNSSGWKSNKAFETRIQNVAFVDNGRLYNLEFEANKNHKSQCTIIKVSGMKNSKGDCQDLMLKAVAGGGNRSEVGGGGGFDNIGVIDR